MDVKLEMTEEMHCKQPEACLPYLTIEMEI